MRRLATASLTALLLLTAGPARADDAPAQVPNPPPTTKQPPAATAEPPQADDTPKLTDEQKKALGDFALAAVGPLDGQLGSLATVKVPAGYKFASGPAMKAVFTLNRSIPSGKELGVVVPEDGGWWLVFEYEDSGHVDDKDKDELDKDKLLAAMKEGSKDMNAERQKRGWPTLQLLGWSVPPHYDAATHNLEWGIGLRSSEGHESVNYDVRLLGRVGVMNVSLACSPATFEKSLAEARQIIAGFKFVQDQDYKAFRQGDKVAEYGLAALVAGGAVAVAAKTGLLGKLWKFIVLGGVALVSAVRRLFGRKTKDGDGGSAT